LAGSGFGLVEASTLLLYEEIEENQEKPVRIAGVLAGIRTKHFPNTSLERYSCTNRLVVKYMELEKPQGV
jgi:hypothetical protein